MFRTQENRFSPIRLERAQDPSVLQVPLQDDGQAGFVKGFHGDRAHGFVVGEKMEDGEEKEEAERQPERAETGRVKTPRVVLEPKRLCYMNRIKPGIICDQRDEQQADQQSRQIH